MLQQKSNLMAGSSRPLPDVQPGDRVQMRKAHPCGGDMWDVYRVGADIGLRCTTCDRQVMLARGAFNKQLKRIVLHQPSLEQGGESS
ncbi:MAG: hypothetical protein UZ15_CFX003001805 [Chloroflexi bacterium OLB15]|nr:MAG: hypothetical protein UZ15_CFX003001805 [Chloroflexi bacterium OLB15]